MWNVFRCDQIGLDFRDNDEQDNQNGIKTLPRVSAGYNELRRLHYSSESHQVVLELEALDGPEMDISRNTENG